VEGVGSWAERGEHYSGVLSKWRFMCFWEVGTRRGVCVDRCSFLALLFVSTLTSSMSRCVVRSAPTQTQGVASFSSLGKVPAHWTC
jgi:hypothetical protein